MRECRTVLFSPEVVVLGDEAGGGSGGGRYGGGLVVVVPSLTRDVGSRLSLSSTVVVSGGVGGVKVWVSGVSGLVWVSMLKSGFAVGGGLGGGLY